MNNSKTIKTYHELIQIPSFDERVRYLMLHGSIGSETFGFDRYINQMFYRSTEWKQLREQIFIRDNGCDLGIYGYDLIDRRSVIIHHITPITLQDFETGSDRLLDPDNLITTSPWTHRLIHYGYGNEVKPVLERRPNDTCPWK